MNVSLTPALEEFVREQVGSGDYNNASEVVRDALRVLRQMDAEREARLESLRRAIDAGDESEGEDLILDSPEDMDRFFGEL